MKCIIIDDNEIALKVTAQYISKVDYLKLLDSFSDPLKALTFIKNNKVDLVFLDIEMPEINGIEFIKSLQHPRPLIIFTTSHKEYALEAYDYNVTDFLVKPMVFSRFLSAVTRAKDFFENQKIDHIDDETIFVKKGNIIVKVDKSDILWIEGLGDYVILNTNKEKFIVHSTMHAMDQKFSSKDFMRVHRSFIIRIDKINNIEDNCISYIDKLIPIGKTYREEVYKKLNLI